MSGARADIIASIRRSLRRGRVDAQTEAELRAQVAAHRRNLIPARAAALDHSGQIDLFVAMAEEVQATVARVPSVEAVPEAVVRYLAAENLPAELVMAPDLGLDDVPWETRPLLRIRRGPAEPEDDHACKHHFEGGLYYHSQHHQRPYSKPLLAPTGSMRCKLLPRY